MRQRRSNCPIACTLDLVGDRWTLLVVRDLVAGKTHFDEFLKSNENIATNILSARLKLLEELGYIARKSDSIDGRRVQYPSNKERKAIAKIGSRNRRLGPEESAEDEAGIRRQRLRFWLRVSQCELVFLGAGGGAPPLLQKSEIPEAKGFGGFPVSGERLRCDKGGGRRKA